MLVLQANYRLMEAFLTRLFHETELFSCLQCGQLQKGGCSQVQASCCRERLCFVQLCNKTRALHSVGFEQWHEDVIFDRNATPKTEYDLDDRSYPLHELLEEWRTVAPGGKYTRIFLLLFRAAGTWLGVLKAVVTARLNGGSNADLVKEFGNEDVRLLVETPKFSGEEEILQALLKILQQPSADGDRL